MQFKRMLMSYLWDWELLVYVTGYTKQITCYQSQIKFRHHKPP